jgi:CHAT domain-containing protein/tetratricopeptide (TPR) repeat protein
LLPAALRCIILLLALFPTLAQTVSDEDAKTVDRLLQLPAAERRAAIDRDHIAVTQGLVRGLCDRGRKLQDNHSFQASEQVYLLAIELARDRHWDRLESIALSGLSTGYREINEYQKAYETQQEGLQISRRDRDTWMIASGASNLSSICLRLGRDEESFAAARESLAAAIETKDRTLEAGGHSSMAVAFKQRGEYRAALTQYLQSLELYQALGSVGAQAIVVGNIGGLYAAQGDLDLAIDYYRRSLPMAVQANYRITEARFTSNLAEAYVGMANWAKARETATRSLELARALNHRETIAGSLAILAEAAWNENRREESITLSEQAVKALDEIGNKDILVTVLPAMASKLLKLGQTQRAMEILARARTLARENGDRASLYEACTTEGIALRQQGRIAEARLRLDEAISTAEELRGNVDSAEAQQIFFADKSDPYHEVARILVDKGAIGEAFAFAERGRSQALLDALRGGHVSLTKAMTPDEKEREAALVHRTATLNRELADARARKSPVAAQEARLQKARIEQEAFERTLYAAHPQLRSQRLAVNAAGVADAVALLPGHDAALLEYLVSDDLTLLLVLTPDMPPAVFKIAIGAKALGKKVESFANRIAGRDLDYRGDAVELDRLLIQPARSLLRGRKSLIVIPDGVLWRLPFAALESDTGASLIERFTLSYTPSATLLREVAARRPHGPMRSILAVGNPPGAKLGSVEPGLEEVVRLYGDGNGRLLTGSAASESVWKREAANFDVLHIASHGVLDRDRPLYSYLSLAGDDANDGFLEARELAEMDLHAQLVVLSACESARGSFGGGEGLVGLTWGLFLAGSPATVASSWKVDSEATSRLMLELHRRLRKGENVASALRSSALALRSNQQYRHPFYWAAFSLSGWGY